MPKNPLFRLLAWNWLAGAAAATILLAGLLLTNAAHLRDLIFTSDSPGVAIGLLMFGFLITFSSVAMGTAIMSLGSNPEPPKGGLRASSDRNDEDAFEPLQAR